jgi:hypothetical protein
VIELHWKTAKQPIKEIVINNSKVSTNHKFSCQQEQLPTLNPNVKLYKIQDQIKIFPTFAAFKLYEKVYCHCISDSLRFKTAHSSILFST